MTIFYVCGHKPQVLDESKAKPGLFGCPKCGETKRAGVTINAPRFSAIGLAARGPLVKTVGA